MNFCEKLKKNLTNTHWCEPSHLISHLQIISNYSRQRQPLPSLVWHTWRAQLASAPDSTAHHYDTQREREREKWELRCHFNWHVTNSHRLPTNHQREPTSPRENGDKSSSAQPQFWRVKIWTLLRAFRGSSACAILQQVSEGMACGDFPLSRRATKWHIGDN